MLLATINTTSTPAPNMTPIAELFGASNPENFITAYTALYIIVNVLTILVFNLGFARKLPILKAAIVYIMMLLGNLLLTFLAFTLPIIESLAVAAIVLGMYKLQLRRHKQESQSENTE
ncbi:positive regulator of sigma E activity [Evansella vedderi]|uniref:Positive regulator of sigma E activity n=1 Tax=Evansella vedderi TaxID=38282 RepID=A0ABT9ZSB5_9BACI|nr:YlaH-like family protein [Evansella vedderi]MDQ0253865.1 positive regulator of sigma E activity [Evansella vedderi]